MNDLTFDWVELVRDIKRRRKAGESREQILPDLYYGVEAELDEMGVTASGEQIMAVAVSLYDWCRARRPRFDLTFLQMRWVGVTVMGT